MRVMTKRPPTKAQEQRYVLVLIVLIVSFAALLPSLLTAISGRPDLYFAKPRLVEPGITVLDWQTLGNLLSAPTNPVAFRPDLFGPPVEIVGYSISIAPSNGDSAFADFLLVPDPGDWLHPPHLHPGEVIDVRVKQGRTIPFVENAPVTVRGTLSFGGMEPHSRVLWHLAATAVASVPR
jgi:hypothetical protein